MPARTRSTALPSQRSSRSFFRQPLILTPDPEHSSLEDRYHALGRTDQDRWLHVTYTLREEGALIRPISARTMHRKERPIYAAALQAHPEILD